jgi:subtilisin family serine protease
VKFRFLVLAVPALAACANWSDDIAGPSVSTVSSSTAGAAMQGGLTDRYIVVFNDDVSNPSALSDDLARAAGATIHFRYTSALKGFAATIPAASLEGIQRNPNVDYVEADGIATVSGSGLDNTATWGLDRIDDRNGIDGSYEWNQDGGNVHAYIIDTGIRTTHTQFGGRAVWGADFIDGTNVDCHGHGTHVAGTVGGSEYGVAKATSLVAVRVLNCQGSGSWSQVIAGIDWVKNNAIKPAVANMSLGGGAISSVNQAVTNAVNSGVVFAVAAGNENTDACTRSPASTPNALTVGATGSNDARASFSNYGTCVDVFAPGVSITSSTNTSDISTGTWSGTSMASPHVAGVAALMLSETPGATPAQVASGMLGGATAGKVTSAGTGSPNLLLYSLVSAGGGGGNNPPTASFTYSCTNLSCDFFGSGSSDTDGTIITYSWNFGDSSTGSGVNTSHTYSSGGTRTVVLTVTDNGGATNSTSHQVTVSAPTGSFTLSANGYKVKGVQRADLSWSGSAASSFDVWRDNAKIAASVAGSSYTDNLNRKGPGSYTYKVCEAGTTTCSNEVQVVF